MPCFDRRSLIGASASLLLWLNGRIAGISGIVSSALNRPTLVRTSILAEAMWAAVTTQPLGSAIQPEPLR